MKTTIEHPMRDHHSTIVFAIILAILVAVSIVATSCSNKTCPAYSNYSIYK
jgi:hypothetical protein